MADEALVRVVTAPVGLFLSLIREELFASAWTCAEIQRFRRHEHPLQHLVGGVFPFFTDHGGSFPERAF